MQAQDLTMVLWAVGLRLRSSATDAIRQALDRGDIIRTHVLRPTWHLIAAKDAQWMLELTAPHIKRSLTARHRELGFTPEIVKKGYRIIERTLAQGRHVTRDILFTKLEQGKVSTQDQRGHHILLMAELDRVICSGKLQEGKSTYALFDERVTEPSKLTREEAIATLMTRYFTSHGPATLDDFAWWSGLPAAAIREGVSLVKHLLDTTTIAGQTYWLKDTGRPTAGTTPSLYLLPAFDEYLVSYRDRSACLPMRHRATAISSNGIFRPVVIANGLVRGLWQKRKVKSTVKIEVRLFRNSGIRRNRELAELLTKVKQRVNAFFEGRKVSNT